MVQLLIQDVSYPTIRQDTINIARTANDPISTFTVALQDDPSQIALSELLEVIFIDESQIANPTHNLLQNPAIAPYTSKYTATTTTGGSFTNLTPGVKLTAANAVAAFGLAQNTQNGLVVAGQFYMLSCNIQTNTLTALTVQLSIIFQTADGTVLNSVTSTAGTTTSLTQLSVSGQAPDGTVTIQVSLGFIVNNATNSGQVSFTSLQLEAMSFISDNFYQLNYPTPFCANGQTNCTLMPDGTAIRQYRLFGGLITKATAGNYVGLNRRWTITVSSYAWLLQKQLLNDSYSNKTDSFMINDLISKYFPNQFSTSQVAVGATLDTFGYTYNGTLRDAIDALAANANFFFYVDAYRVIWYQPPGFTQIGFTLSDNPDFKTSFSYYDYQLDLDATQLGNACVVTGATNISAVVYDAASIAYYNQKTNGQGIFWRTVSDTTITTTPAARQRAIAENTTYNFARKIAHLSTNQMMVPGQTVLLTSIPDKLIDASLLIQSATLVIEGFTSLEKPLYQCECELGAFNPDMVNITVKMLRKQQVNVNSIGTPVIGLMATESLTFVDSILVRPVFPNPATYGMGVYGTSTYAAGVSDVPTTEYGVGTYGDPAKGYN